MFLKNLLQIRQMKRSEIAKRYDIDLRTVGRDLLSVEDLNVPLYTDDDKFVRFSPEDEPKLVAAIAMLEQEIATMETEEAKKNRKK